MKVKLKDVANISAGQGAPQGDSSYSENGIPFVKAGDLLDLLKGKPIINIQKVTEDIARKYKLKLYSKGTVLFAKSGMSCLKGYVYTLPSNAYVVSHLACITPNIDISKFLQYYFNYYKPNQLVKDKSYPSISLTDIGNMMIDLKTPEKRILIVTVLDKVSDLIALRKKQLAKLDELVKARFVEMFGEFFVCNINEKKLKDICKFIDYRGKTPEKSLKGFPLITAKNVRNNKFSIFPQEFIPEENYDMIMSRGVPQVNDVLFTTEAPLGNVCRIPDVYDKFCVGQRIITMQPHENTLTSEYLEYALLNNDFQNKIWNKSSGSTVKGIRSKLLEQLTIPVPLIGNQQNFTGLVKQVDKQKAVIKQSLEKLETLKKSLMQEYFG